MTYRRSSFDPGHVEPREAAVKPYDLWQWLGILAYGAGFLLIAHDIADLLGLVGDRDYPGALLLLAMGGTILLGYRSRGGLLGSRTPAFRRMLGLALTLPGLFLVLLELVG